MKKALQRLLPDSEWIRAHPRLRWLAPAMGHPRLWRLTRRGVALGVGIGVFFGLLVPIAQIPLSAATAVVLRANIPTAVASTLVSNPVTYAPLYYASYKVGSALLGERPPRDSNAAVTPREPGVFGWLAYWWSRIAALGLPLLVGMAVMATTAGLATWLLTTWLWRIKVWYDWRRRQRRRQERINWSR